MKHQKLGGKFAEDPNANLVFAERINSTSEGLPQRAIVRNVECEKKYRRVQWRADRLKPLSPEITK
jgi:hypothetical protein